MKYRYTKRLVCLALLLLAGCTSGPPPRAPVDAGVVQAQSAMAHGNYREAAMLWQEAALVAVGPRRESYRLNAAEAWLRAGERAQSESQLSQVEDQLLNSEGLSRFGLLQAELALSRGDTGNAEFYLEVARANLVASQRSRYLGLLDRVNRINSDQGSYAMAMVAAELAAMGTYSTQRGIALLQMLEDVPSAVLEGYSRDESAAGLDRWPELAVGIRRLLVRGGDPEAAAEQWQFDHPGHVVTEVLYSDLTRAYRNLYRLPRDIAVLLPSDGGLTTAGNAIRDGLVSAYLENDDGVTLRFYSTTDDPQSAISAYFQAAGEGAQWIIGPLRNTSVAALANLGGLGLPVLALNSFEADNSDSPRNNSLFSLSLSQEQEAKAIARRALANGWTAAILLTADNAWGQRMESAFAEEFIAGGGKVTTSAPFDPAVSDHGELLTGALMISDSHDRKNRVQATLGINLNFEPTRRDDFDVFFLAATPAQGRQIRPQLRFHEAGDKPVFAMGRIWSGIDEATANQDLNGVYFPTTNWQLQQPTGEGQAGFNSLRGGALASLHALGIDAWSVLPWLPLLRKDTDLQFPGAVGSLYMSENGQLLRDPAWAQFSRGRPVPVAWEQPEG